MEKPEEETPTGRCIQTTAKKKQCSRKAVLTDVYCKQHGGKVTYTTTTATVAGLPALPSENGAKINAKITKLLKREPPTSGNGGGSIYVYRMARETGLNYWKVGMTERSVDKRMREWEKTHKDRVICVDRFLLTNNVALAEELIHLYLDYCRMYRSPSESDTDGTLFRSTWFRSGELIKDAQWEKIQSQKERLVASKKHNEWFCCEKKTLDAVVHAVVAHCQQKK